MPSERQSNIELCRIASIILVMVVHTTFPTFGWDSDSLWVRTLAGFSIVGANVFVLITGYFSATPKKTSLINLAFICLFWGIIGFACKYLCGRPVGVSNVFFITRSNWFVVCYIGLLFFAPILNVYCNTVSKRMLWGGVLLLTSIQIWFDWLPPYPSIGLGSREGYSLISFINLYLLARAIKLYGLPEWFKKLSPLIYLSCSILLVVGSQYTRGDIFGRTWWFAYNNPIVILSSVAFLICFERLKFQSKFVNHIAKSTLALLLGHAINSFLYSKPFIFIYDNYSGVKMMALWFAAILVAFCIIVSIDQIRLFLYGYIQRYVNRIIKQNEFCN